MRFITQGINIWLTDVGMLISVFLLDDVVLGFYNSNLTQETGEIELASTITLAIHANWQTKCSREAVFFTNAGVTY